MAAVVTASHDPGGTHAALADEVCGLARRAGADAVGITSAEPFDETRAALESRKEAGLHGGMHFTYGNPARATDPAATMPGARALVVAARSYRRAAPDPPPDDGDGRAAAYGEVARYSWRDHYEPLRRLLTVVAARLAGAGWRAEVLVDDNRLVDRAAAYRAGLGWFGKNSMLLLPEAGSWFVLGSVVTDAPLPATAAGPVSDGCGTCRRCMDACPTGALTEPGVLDARRCLAWLLEAPGPFPVEHRAALGGRIYGCDECQVVCPPNRLADRREPPPPPAPDDEPWVPLVGLLEMGDRDVLDSYGRWYIPQRNPRYVRRNALVALGNVGDGRAPDVARVLATVLAGDDPLLREHAAWAAHRLGRADLVAGDRP